MLRDLATEKLLSDADMDQLGRVVANLLEEVIVLSERVATLEENAAPETMPSSNRPDRLHFDPGSRFGRCRGALRRMVQIPGTGSW